MILRFLFFILFFTNLAFSSIIIDNNFKKLDHFELLFFHDKNSKLTINQIQNTQFKNKIQNSYTLGYRKGTIWLKIEIFNQSDLEKLYLFFSEAYFEKLNLYQQIDNKWGKISNGFLIPIDDREIKNLIPSFKINLQEGKKQTIYFEIHSEFQQYTKIMLKKEDSLPNEIFYVIIFSAFYFGAMMIFFIFNGFLYIKFKDPIYGYYTLYIVSWVIFMLFFSGFSQLIELNSLYDVLNFSAPLSVLSLLLFTQSFLKVQKHYPKIIPIYKIFNYTFIMFTILNVINVRWFYTSILASSLAFMFMMFVSFIIAYRGYRYAKIYFTIMGINMFGLMILTLMSDGFIDNNYFTRYLFLFTSFFEIICLSFLLISRFNEIQLKKLNYQNKVLELKNKNEEKLNILVKQKGKELKYLLRENELLLKEVNHRVKNNLHMIASLLWLESEKINNQNDKKNFDNLNRKIKSISLVHQYLYNDDSNDKINCKDFVKNIINNLKGINEIDNINIKTYITIKQIQMDQAITLSTIITEVLVIYYQESTKENQTLVQFNIEQKKDQIKLDITMGKLNFSNHLEESLHNISKYFHTQRKPSSFLKADKKNIYISYEI